MAEKILNTRISLRYDSYENWIANDPILRAGELALAAVTTKQNGAVEHVPSVLIKCGDGTHKYSELDYVFAKAADVVSAAKSEAALTEFINNVIANSGIATDEALTALSGRVTTAEGKITALQGLVGDTKVSEQINAAIAALNLADTYAAKVHTHTKADITDFAHTHAMTEVTGLTDAIADAKKAGTDAATELGTYKVTNDAAVKANADAIAAINHADTGILAQAKSYADGKDAAIAAAKKAGDDAQTAVDTLAGKVGAVPADKTVIQMISEAQAAATYDDTQIKKDIKANADAIGVLEGYVGGENVSTQIQTAITNLNLPTTYEAKGAAATVKTELVGKNTDTADSATIAGAKKYADGLNTAMDTRVDALEAAIGEGGSVGAQIDAKIQTLDVEDTAVAGQYVSAVSETDGKITVTRAALPDYTEVYDAKGAAAQALTDAKSYADGLNTAMDTRMDSAEGKLTTLIGSDADKSVRTIANEELAAQLIPENAAESLNTLQEIAQWIQDHPGNASAMNAAIEALEAKVGENSVSAQINAAIEALKIGDYAKAADLTAAVGRIATLEGDMTAAKSDIGTLKTDVSANTSDIATIKGTGDGSITKTVSDAIAALDVTDTAVDHQFVTAVSETDGKISVSRAVITTDDIAQGTMVLVFDCGDSTTV